ncbi:MAG: hypothetical protein ACK5SX_05475, partial [Sandaracinobacter sp.]
GAQVHGRPLLAGERACGKIAGLFGAQTPLSIDEAVVCGLRRRWECPCIWIQRGFAPMCPVQWIKGMRQCSAL